MIDGQKILGLIPARGGSKGVPRKNVRTLGGKPLICWTIEAALDSVYLDSLVVTTEDIEIANVARTASASVPFIRPADLAQDLTPAMDVVRHALSQLDDFDLIVYLQPTSPLRTTSDIDKCIEYARAIDAVSCVSVCQTTKSPEWMFRIHPENGYLQPILEGSKLYPNRQQAPPVYTLNGAIYVVDTRWFASSREFVTSQTSAWEMPLSRSVDIDTELDFQFCSFLLERQFRDPKP